MADPERLDRLSPKMRAVHELDLRGLSPAEIGKRLLLSEFAVRIFLEDIEERLGRREPDPLTGSTSIKAAVDNQERLDRLTPRERDVYEVWTKHPDWSNAQIGYAVLFPAPHIVRRYKENIRRKLADPDPTFGRSPRLALIRHDESPAREGRRARGSLLGWSPEQGWSRRRDPARATRTGQGPHEQALDA